MEVGAWSLFQDTRCFSFLVCHASQLLEFVKVSELERVKRTSPHLDFSCICCCPAVLRRAESWNYLLNWNWKFLERSRPQAQG